MNNVKEQLTNKAKRNIIYLGMALINAAFLCLWAATQFGAAKFINWFIVWISVEDAFNTIILNILRILIAVSTLYPIGKNIHEDIVTINLETSERIKKLTGNKNETASA